MQQYDKTEWVPEVTLVSAQRLNKIERQLETLTNESIKSNSQLSNVIAKNNEFDKVFNNAKYDYFGDEHISVVERLASDFDNIHQRINDASYLEYSGSNIKADNSYYGYTKEMSVKGRTLQNLCIPKKLPTVENTTNTGLTYGEAINVKTNTTYTIIYEIKASNKINCTSIASLFRVETILNEGVYQGTLYYGFIGNMDENFTKVVAKFTIPNIDNLHKIEFNLRNAYNDYGLSSNILTVRNVILLEGDYTNVDFDIPYFEGIKSVGENDVTEEGKYPVKIKSCGKNLFDEQYLLPGGIIALSIGDTYIGNNRPTHKNGRTIFHMPIKPNTTYYLKSEGKLDRVGTVYTLNKDKVCVADGKMLKFNNKNNFYKITTTHDSYYLEWYLGQDINDLVHNVFISTSIDDMDLPYEPYQESVQEILLDEPLRSLPNGVCDEILEDGTEIRRVGKVVLDGSLDEGWGIYTSNWVLDGSTVFSPSSQAFPNAKGYTWGTYYGSPAISNRFPSYGDIYLRTTNVLGFTNDNVLAIKRFRIPNSLLDSPDVQGFKTWLSKNPTTVYYELAEPIITKHNKKINLKTYAGTTHVTSDNYLQPKISCKVPSNVQAVISNLKEENEALNTQVSTLNLENADIKETNANQDELINTTMMATNEMYMMLEPLLANMLVDGESISPLVNMYAAMVQRGLKTIEQVPTKWREQVKKELCQLQE